MKLKPSTDKKVLVAMSGGLDSTVTAALLKNQGYHVQAIFLRLGDPATTLFKSHCCLTSREESVRETCSRLDIPLQVIDARAEFTDRVEDYALHESLALRAPYPCVLCNREVKFHHLLKMADQLGCQKVATGHYAQVRQDAGQEVYRLFRAVDPERDQSHELFHLSQKELKRILMPLGGLPKQMVYKMAQELSVLEEDRNRPRGPCMGDPEDYIPFVESRAAQSLRPKGVIKAPDNTLLGEHGGLYRHRLGQAVRLEGSAGRESVSMVVVSHDAEKSVLGLGPEKLLLQSEIAATESNWLRPMNEVRGLECLAQFSYRSPPVASRVTFFENRTLHVRFESPQQSVLPGQPVVFYDEDEVLGGAFIDRFGAHDRL